MLANYGYQDGSGVYYITIDTDKCSGCEECVKICPKDVFEMVLDDYDELVPKVTESVINQIGFICQASICDYQCQKVCPEDAIIHSW